MRIDILTIFPRMFTGFLQESILARAQKKGLVEIDTVDIREFSHHKHRRVDDYPFGGGAGMVMACEPICLAVEAVRARHPGPHRSILLSPRGPIFTQEKARELAGQAHLILVCGHYEGVDERVLAAGAVDEELSIGDYILTGGEPAALVVVDAVVRLLPGVLGDDRSPQEESFQDGILEYPQYTRPREFRGLTVPEVLLSGLHEAIRRWRRRQALQKTLAVRPDLLAKARLTAEDRRLLQQIMSEAQEQGEDGKECCKG